MDYSSALGIDYRVVKEADYHGQTVRIVGGSRTFAAEIDELWDAITNAERISRWFAPITGDLELGGRYQLEGNAGGEITLCDPPKAFDLTWVYFENVSWVTVRLETVAGGTLLTLEHLMAKDEASEEHWKKYGPGATGVGWELGFLGLGLHLQERRGVEKEDHEAWLESTEGKSFLTACAMSWGDAHVRSGEDQGTAMAMAEETAAFYRGETPRSTGAT
ncbi:MAG: SRPBCC domain-containing protein [Acidobacteriota bacterium]